MPFAVLGLHILLATLCADHAARTGQARGWPVVVYALPALGCLAYVLAAWLPSPLPLRGAQPRWPAATPQGPRPPDHRAILLAARVAFEAFPSAQNRLGLIAALLDGGAVPEAIQHCEAGLRASFGKDPEFRFMAARACVQARRFTDALTHLDAARLADAAWRGEAAALLRARCLAALGKLAATRAEYESALQRFGSYEVRAEYEIWALIVGDRDTAQRLRTDTDRISAGWTGLARQRHAAVRRRLLAARDLARRTD